MSSQRKVLEFEEFKPVEVVSFSGQCNPPYQLLYRDFIIHSNYSTSLYLSHYTSPTIPLSLYLSHCNITFTYL